MSPDFHIVVLWNLFTIIEHTLNGCRPSRSPAGCMMGQHLLSSTGLPDRHHHQRQHQLLPHVQEDVSEPPRYDGAEPRRSARTGGLRPSVQRRLPQRFTAHVRHWLGSAVLPVQHSNKNRLIRGSVFTLAHGGF